MGEQTVEPTCEQNLLPKGRTKGGKIEKDRPISSLTCDLGLKIRRQNPSGKIYSFIYQVNCPREGNLQLAPVFFFFFLFGFGSHFNHKGEAWVEPTLEPTCLSCTPKYTVYQEIFLEGGI